MNRVREAVKAWGDRHPKLKGFASNAITYAVLTILWRWQIMPRAPAGHRFFPGLVWGLGIVMVLCAITLPIEWGPRTPEFRVIRWIAPGCLVIGAGLIALGYQL